MGAQLLCFSKLVQFHFTDFGLLGLGNYLTVMVYFAFFCLALFVTHFTRIKAHIPLLCILLYGALISCIFIWSFTLLYLSLELYSPVFLYGALIPCLDYLTWALLLMFMNGVFNPSDFLISVHIYEWGFNTLDLF